MELGTLLFIAAYSYGLGIFWYSLLPAHMPERVWRVAALPFVLIVLVEGYAAGGFIPGGFELGPTFGGVHVALAVISSFVGVLIDWIITELRHPAVMHERELEPKPIGKAA